MLKFSIFVVIMECLLEKLV